MKLSIRCATEADMDLIRQLDLETVLSTAREIGKTNAEIEVIARNHKNVFQQYFDLTTQKVWLAEADGKTVGFIWLIESTEQFTEKTYGFIMDIGVAKDYRRHGIGRKLMAVTEEYSRQKGYKALKLMVNARNKIALSFYRNLKFEVEDFYMKKSL